MKKITKLIIAIIVLSTKGIFGQATVGGNMFNLATDYLGWDATPGSPPLLIKTTNPDPINFSTGNVPRMTILANGRVGIGTGTTTLVELFEVNGNIHLLNQTSTINLNGSNQVFIANPNPSNILIGIGAGTGLTGASSCTFIGENAGATAPIAGGGNTYLGWWSGRFAVGDENTFVGSRAGNGNSATSPFTGVANTFIGVSAGQLSLSGNENCFMGEFAGLRNNANRNVFIGTLSGTNNVGGRDNVFLGTNSGSNNLSGSNNAFMGHESGLGNMADNNTFLGALSGHTNVSTSGETFVGFRSGFGASGANNTYIGSESGQSTNAAAGSTFVGFQSGFANTASFNTFIGMQSGLANTTATGLTFVGYHSGLANTLGVNNTFLGYESGAANTTFAGNTFVGYHTGLANKADNNTFIGMEAGLVSGTAIGLTFVGYHAGVANTGADNMFAGYNAGAANSAGQQNTFVGSGAGSSNLNNNNSTYIGFQSGTVATGASNTMVGSNSGIRNTGGNQNTFVGQGSGNQILAGSNNTYFGFQAGPPSATYSGLSNSAVIGANAQVLNTNDMILGDNSVEVGIGLSGDAAGPRSKLEIKSGVANVSGLQFTNLTSASLSTIGAYGKVLTVDVTGKVALTDDIGGGNISSSCGSLPTNYIIKATGSSSICTSSIYEDAALNVGIGSTFLPNAKLEVNNYQPTTSVIDAIYVKSTDGTNYNQGIGASCITSTTTPSSYNKGFIAIMDGAERCRGFECTITNNYSGGGQVNKAFGATVNGINSSNLGLELFVGDNTTNATSNYGVKLAVGNPNHSAPYTYGVRVSAWNGSIENYGVWAESRPTQNNTGISCGVYGFSGYNSITTDESYGLYGVASGGTVINYGLYASNYNTGTCSGIGCANAAAFFNGPICATQSSWVPSDSALKINVNDLLNANTILSQLNPKKYYYDTLKYHMNLSSGLQFGLIAQELALVLPQLTRAFANPEEKDSMGNVIHQQENFTGISYEPLITLLIAGYQEQQIQIDSLINAIAAGNQPKMANPNNMEVTLSNQSKIILNQNDPNPFAENTTINYFIPDNVNAAQLLFYDNSGTILKTVDIKEKGKGSVLIYGSNLSSGVYSYTLLADNKPIDTKRMVKVK